MYTRTHTPDGVDYLFAYSSVNEPVFFPRKKPLSGRQPDHSKVAVIRSV